MSRGKTVENEAIEKIVIQFCVGVWTVLCECVETRSLRWGVFLSLSTLVLKL